MSEAMKRPLKPVTQTEEEKRSERRFTRRMLLLTLAGGIFGLGVQTITHTMGKPPTPMPPGVPPPPQFYGPVSPPRPRGK
jgi:hypothetical protein